MMFPKFELRWFVRQGWDGPEKHLQYRYKYKKTDYGLTDPTTGSFITEKVWSEWQAVPTVEDK